MLTNILSFLKARPAIAAGLVSVAVTLLAQMGLHLSASQLAVVISMFNASLASLVHVSTTPAGKHESAPREEHP